MTVDTPAGHDGLSMIGSYAAAPMPDDLRVAAGRMVAELRGFLDGVAAAGLDVETATELRETLAAWGARLSALEVPERERVYGRLRRTRGRGQVLVPALHVLDKSDEHLEGTVCFGDFHLGANRAVHGGAISLLFDDVLGGLAHRGRLPSRTVSLTTDFRAITPVGPELTVRAWVDRIEGRKRFVRGSLHHGDVLTAEAQALFVELKSGQQ